MCVHLCAYTCAYMLEPECAHACEHRHVLYTATSLSARHVPCLLRATTASHAAVLADSRAGNGSVPQLLMQVARGSRN